MIDPAPLIVKRTRTGLGLFTMVSIKSDQRIIEYRGEIITVEESDRRGGRYLFQRDERRVIDGKARSNRARYINHSCTPNAIGYVMRNKVWIYAMGKIEAGAEITIDYGEEYCRYFMSGRECRCESCLT